MEWETPDVSTSIRFGAVDGGFASTLEAAVLDTQMDDLDDAMIERSIAEINAAIRRSAANKA